MEGTLPEPGVAGASRALRALAAIPPPPIGGLLAPADRVRSRLLRFLAPRARSLVVARDRRVALAASCLLLCALVSSSVVPMWLLALGPIVWGVPHIVSDVRYLVARPGYHRRPWVMAAIGAGIVASGLGFGLRGALAGAGGALLFSRATAARRAIGLAVLGGLLAVAQWAGFFADLVFAHAHNVVGVLLWWAWRRRETRLHWLPLLIFAGGGAIILAGLTEPIVGRTHGLVAPWTGLTARSLAWGLSPTPDGPIAARLLMLYAFWQAAHYVVWLRLIPEDDRPSPTPRSYLQSYRALRADVGSVVLWIAMLSAIAVAAWAAVNVGQARNGYIQLAFFHGYLELAAAALLWGEGRLAWDAPRPAAA
jgi:hypothetical protein